MKKLLAAGDSFTYGEELQDLTQAWPFLVGSALGLQVVNLGAPGGSNQKVVRLLLQQDLTDVDLICIGWSHYDRTEIADELGLYDTWPGGYRKKYREQAPWRSQLIDYISHHHCDDYLYQQYLQHIISVQSWCKVNGIPYVMMDAFGNHQDPRRTAEKFQPLLTQIDSKNFLGWPDQSMIEWTKSTPQGWGHFLEEGHRMVAGKIIDHVRSSTKNVK